MTSPLLVSKSVLLVMIVLSVVSATAAHRLLLNAIHRRKAIVNGQTVDVAEQPYYAFQVLLLVQRGNGSIDGSCGGSIIAPSYVLTAGHCLGPWGYATGGHRRMDIKSENGSFLVVAGKTNLPISDPSQKESGFHVRFASEVWIHQDFVNSAEVSEGKVKVRLSDDIAILKLDVPFTFSDRVRSIALSPDDSGLRVGTDVSTTGWGTLLAMDSLIANNTPLKLQKVTVDHLPDVCAKNLTSGGYKDVEGIGLMTYYDEQSMICAGCQMTGTGTCTGDSGGPLFALSSAGGCPVEVGVTSWGGGPFGGCGISLIPDIYARVSRYLPWIESVVRQPVRSTVPLSPTADCQNCGSDDFPDGENCDKAMHYDCKPCVIQARLAASFSLSTPACQDRRRLTLKAVIDFRKGFPNATEDLKRTINDGQVVFLYSDQGTGNGVISLPPPCGRNGERINTPLRNPKVLAAKVDFDAKESAWVYSSSNCSCSSSRTYAAVYVKNSDSVAPLYRQISIAVTA